MGFEEGHLLYRLDQVDEDADSHSVPEPEGAASKAVFL